MNRSVVVTTASVLSAILAVGCLGLAIAHFGIEVPGLSRIGPGGGRVILPAAIAFSVATVLLALLAVGIWRRRAWSWAAGLAVHGMVLAGAMFPYRGLGSLIGIVLAGAAFVLLATPAARDAMVRNA